ncbi:MAG: electron transfer flavoprotein subunit beta/FixA family protein [Oligoflexia bacterium]|nr:electron transfer flavoprotein subunit beta/FixA family protein [Oligoflexia bacterium]
MVYKIIVLAKQVPDTKNIIGEAMRPDGTVNRAALPAIFNPEDLQALEMALLVKDRFPQSKISVITMGPIAAIEILREALFRGADDGYLISDKQFAAADTLATSYTLTQAIKTLSGHGDPLEPKNENAIDLIFCGRQAIDGDTAQVGPQVAANLGIPQVTYAFEIVDIGDHHKNQITLKRQLDDVTELVRAQMPLLITVTDSASHARPRDIRRTIFLRKKKIPVWNIRDITASPDRCGLKGSPTNVLKINSVILSLEGKNTQTFEATPQSMDKLAKILRAELHQTGTLER